MSHRDTEGTEKVADIPSYGFARGAVVRHCDSNRNMLVVRGLGTTTVVVVVEDDEAGSLRLREIETAKLRQVLAHGQSGPPAPVHDWSKDADIIAGLARAVAEPARSEECIRHHRALLVALNGSHVNGEQDALCVFEAVARLLAQLIGSLPDDTRYGTLRYIVTRADALRRDYPAAEHRVEHGGD